MTKEEVFKKYGDVPLKFDHYYKYAFTFRGIAPDSALISMQIGGYYDEVYRFEFDKNTVFTLKEHYDQLAFGGSVIVNGNNILWNEYDP